MRTILILSVIFWQAYAQARMKTSVVRESRIEVSGSRIEVTKSRIEVKGPRWTGLPQEREAAIQHLTTGRHHFTREQLQGYSLQQLEELHSQDHNTQTPVKVQCRSYWNGRRYVTICN